MLHWQAIVCRSIRKPFTPLGGTGMIKRILLAALCCNSLACAALAEDYNLFNPVPDDKMRTMSTERPSISDSPYTIDSGHLQLETSVLSSTHDSTCAGGGCVKTNFLSAGNATTIRLGLTQSSEIQVIGDLYDRLTVSDKTNHTRNRNDGYGDTVVRYKYNLWGNDGNGTAIAILPYVKIPTNQNDLGNHDVEGGVNIPYSWTIDEQWSIGGTSGISRLHDDDNGGYVMGYSNIGFVNYNFTEKFSGFTELATFREEDHPQWNNTIGAGVVYAVNPNLNIDSDVNIGISRAADDVNWLTGFSYRY
jgi:hypothetical protein